MSAETVHANIESKVHRTYDVRSFQSLNEKNRSASEKYFISYSDLQNSKFVLHVFATVFGISFMSRFVITYLKASAQ